MGIIRSGLQSLMNFPGSYVFLFLCLMTRDSITSTVGGADLKTSAKKVARLIQHKHGGKISFKQYRLISTL